MNTETHTYIANLEGKERAYAQLYWAYLNSGWRGPSSLPRPKPIIPSNRREEIELHLQQIMGGQ